MCTYRTVVCSELEQTGTVLLIIDGGNRGTGPLHFHRAGPGGIFGYGRSGEKKRANVSVQPLFFRDCVCFFIANSADRGAEMKLFCLITFVKKKFPADPFPSPFFPLPPSPPPPPPRRYAANIYFNIVNKTVRGARVQRYPS